MAATYGRLTGKAGVCMATLGPGATNFATPAAYAQLGGMPLIRITGQKPIKKSKQGQFQIIDVVGRAQEEDGYLHTEIQIRGIEHFSNRKYHEMYNYGHLFTAACIHLMAWALPATAQVVFEEVRLNAGDARSDDHFGSAVSLSGDIALIGSPDDFHNGVLSGSASVFVRQGTVWIEEVKLTASDAEPFDRFGLSVAVYGDTAVVSAPRDDDACPGDPACDSGSAYVFVRQGTEWFEQAIEPGFDVLVNIECFQR